MNENFFTEENPAALFGEKGYSSVALKILSQKILRELDSP